MKYVITGASTFAVSNMGDDAMLACMVQSLYREDPDAEIVFIARHPSQEYDELFGIYGIKNLDHESNKAAEGRIFLGFNRGDSGENLLEIKKYIEDADLLIFGGNSIMEVSKNTFLKGVSSYCSTLAILAKFCGTPYALFGLNIVDPIRDELTKEHAKFLCENAIAVTVREDVVLKYLSDIGVSTSNTVVSGDPAFGMEVDETIDPVNILKNNNIILNTDKKIISIGYRFEYWLDDENLFHKNAEKIAEFIDLIIESFDSEILFIPNCTYTQGNKWEDDRLVNDIIRSKLKHKENCHFITQELNVYETFRLFLLTDLHISNRRHANAFAVMNGKPFLSISISLATHMSALLDTLESPDLELSLQLEVDSLIEKVNFVFSEEEKISSRLLEKSLLLKVQAQQHIPIIIAALQAQEMS